MATYLSIPYTESLKNGSGWEQPVPDEPRYRTIRINLVLENDRSLPEPLRMGDVLSAHKGKQDVVHAIEVERETLNLTESFARSFDSVEVLDQLSSKLGSAAGPISAELKSSLAESIKSELETTETLRTVETVTETVKFSVTYKLDTDSEEPRIIAAVYQRRAIDVYLEYVDFLNVEYSRPTFGLHKKRLKSPPHSGTSNRAPNEVHLALALGTFSYWSLLPLSSWMVKESEYRCEVTDPLEVRREQIAKPRKHPRKFPPTPSLYQLANIAFPLRLDELTRGRWAKGESLQV